MDISASTLSANPASAELPDVVGEFKDAPTELLGAVLDQSLDCIKVIGPTGRLDFMNRNGRCAMEIDDFALVAGRNWWDLWPEASRHLVEGAVVRAQAGESSRFEAFCPTAKGSPRWWEVSVAPLRDKSGELRGIVSTSRDITDRVNSAELRDAAAEEMKHRLKNAYALAGAIMTAAARGSPERQDFAGEVLDRLHRLSVAQTLLLDPAALGEVDLRTLFEHLTKPLSNTGCAFVVGDLPDVRLGEEDTRALALVLGELGTNSSKYGAIGRGGSVVMAGTLNGGHLALEWREHCNNPMPPRGLGPDGNGFRLINRALAARGGSMDVRWEEAGPQVSITLPLANAG